MPTLFKTAALSLSLLAGAAVAAQAQTAANAVVPGQSIANLPPEGPRASSYGHVSSEQQMPVVQSGNYPGRGPGATNGSMPPLYQKPADWDQNIAMHPYTSNMGPKAH